ncbi:hypothetical protein KBC85_01340 [Candidatus Saccharibacteria bacterium]|nr:hypothetical protein [Candidatus Saccharibacteria bacterium]MDQ5958322.1 hypothetical protein [Patescibacteria group bacterium]
MAEKINLPHSEEHLKLVASRGMGAGAIILDGQSKPTDPTNTLFQNENPLDFEGRVTVEDYVMDEPRRNLLFALRIKDYDSLEDPNTTFDRALYILALAQLPPSALTDKHTLKEHIYSVYPNLRSIQA